MVFYALFLLAFCLICAVYLSRAIFAYDQSHLAKNKKIAASIVLFLLISGILNTALTPKVRKFFHLRNAEQYLLKSEVVQLIKQKNNEAYQSLLAEVEQAFDHGISQQQLLNNIREIISAIALKHMRSASDALVVEFGEMTLTQAKYLKNMPDDACFKLMFPELEGSVAEQLMPPHMLEQEQALLAKALKSDKQEVEHLSEEQVMKLGSVVFEQLNENFAPELLMFDDPGSQDVNRDRMCEMTIALYSEILKLPTHEAAQVLRWVLNT